MAGSHSIYMVKCVKYLTEESIDTLQSVQPSSIWKLREYALEVKNTDLHNFLLHNVEGIKIHRNCQKKIYNFLRSCKGNSKSMKKHEKIKTRKDGAAFNWHRDCMYCQEPCKVNQNNRNRIIIFEARNCVVANCSA